MIEAKSASSSANEVSMMTLVSGRAARISRVASIPLPSSKRTSMTTTSGRTEAATSTASWTPPASPATTMPPAASNRARSPWRTTSWSSTSMTRIGWSLITSSVAASERDPESHGRPPAGSGFDVEASADGLGPSPEVPQAAPASGSGVRVEAGAVVLDDESQRIPVSAELHRDRLRIGVSDRVRHRLPDQLEDVVGMWAQEGGTLRLDLHPDGQ